jgi:hypothetical protein
MAAIGFDRTRYKLAMAYYDEKQVLLMSWEFVSAITNTMVGKTSFVDSNRIANFLLLKHTNMPILTLVFFIVTSVRVTS